MKWTGKIWFIIILFTIGCNSGNRNSIKVQKPSRYKTFEGYLNNEFNIQIDTNSQYLIVPGLVCRGCVTHALAYTLKVLNGNTPNNLLIILSNSDLIKGDSFLNRPILRDKNWQIDKLDLPINNATLIEVKSDSTLVFYTSSSKDYKSIGNRLKEIYLGK